MMVVLISETVAEGGRTAARIVGQAIQNNPALKLGLAAGNTPIGLYRNLVRLHRAKRLDFSRVRIFSLDELLGMPASSPNSYHAFFHHHLLRHINADPAHLHLLDGQIEDIASYCSSYEQLIRDNGSIDLQLLGIGPNGHVGFNEPGSSLNSRTRISLLSASTRRNMARLFDHSYVPEWAVTMGLATIREARALMLLAFGKQKAAAVAKAVEGAVSASIPASSIQLHPTSILVLDHDAASSLKNREYYQQEATQLEALLPDWLR